jgi:hypothetical protein
MLNGLWEGRAKQFSAVPRAPSAALIARKRRRAPTTTGDPISAGGESGLGAIKECRYLPDGFLCDGFDE